MRYLLCYPDLISGFRHLEDQDERARVILVPEFASGRIRLRCMNRLPLEKKAVMLLGADGCDPH